jgi:hypothetical protein
MAYPSGNAFYPKWKQTGWQEAPANKSLDQSGANGVYCALLQIQAGNPNISYTYDVAHQFYTDLIAPNPGQPQSAVFNVGALPGANPGALLQQVTTPTFNIVGAAPVFDGDDVTFLNVTSIFGNFPVVGALVLFRMNAGLNNTWRLIYYCDTGAGFPVTPNGGNVTIQWNASGIFAI